MTERIRRVAIALTALFLVLAAQLTYLQVVAADRLANHPRNVRPIVRTYAEPRGPILSAEEVIIARSEPVDTELRYLRRYPTGSLFGHVSGFYSFTFGASGVEAAYNDDLAGRTPELRYRDLGDLLVGKEHTGTVVLTLRADVQEAAREALAGRRGSVVALDPRSGAVLAMYAEPSFDPSPLAGHDQAGVRAAREQLLSDPANPLLARAWRERYPPGSTFKVVTAAVALEQGAVQTDTSFPVLRELDLPQTDRPLSNFGGSSCGGSLVESFRRSCNTTFGRIGLDLGEDFVDGIQQFGIGDRVPLDVEPDPARSSGPESGSFRLDQPSFAFAGIGQGDVFVTPLQMALVVSGIANGGVIMEPHVVAEVRDVDGTPVERARPREWRRAVSDQTAAQVAAMMVEVVARGTGTRAQIPGVTVAGKTGTAQTGREGEAPHAWFVAFAPAEEPQVVVAVIVERGGDLGSEATGGRVAAPVARAVVAAALSPPGTGGGDG